MAKEKKEKTKEPKEKSKFNIKILLFGIPLFILQLIVVYFVTANFLLEKWNPKNHPVKTNITAEDTSNEENTDSEVSESEEGKYVYLVKDVIVNPAKTGGKRLLLTSIGFDLATKENEDAIKEKEIPVRDVIISTLSSKTIDQLNDYAYKDSLKTEIAHNVKKLVPHIKVNKVYFSKYIIQ